MLVRTLMDSLASYLAAIVTLCVCAFPSWFTHVAVQGGLAPKWAYASVALLCVIGAVLSVAFVRKGLRGIAPSRQRRRT